MSISEQVKELRGNSVELNRQPYMQRILKQAADTIEFLSAKLQVANIERPAEDCVGWIPCKDRLPDKNGMYLVTLQNIWDESLRILDTVHYISEWDIGGIEDDFAVTAWRKLPEPYHEP